MTDEKSIVEQFAAGSHAAFRELFMRYHLKVYYFILGLVKSEGDAEDLHTNRLTIHFNKNESLENVLMLIKEMIPGLEYQIKEEGIVIY